jgi:hypothetical protein
MRYFLLIPAIIFGPVFGFVMFGLVPGVVGTILMNDNNNFLLVYPPSVSSYAGVAGLVILPVVVFFVLRAWPND